MNKKEIIQRAFFFRDHIIANKQARKALKLISNSPLLLRHNNIISDPYGSYTKDNDTKINPGNKENFKVINLTTKNNLFYHDQDLRTDIGTERDP